MSLVERALKKMQESRSHAAAATAASSAAMPAPVLPDLQPPAPALGSVAPATRPLAEPIVGPTRIVNVDRDKLRADTILPPTEQERRLADEFRQIKRPLIASALGRGVPRLPNGHVIMLASALPGDGKTFTSINLALSMAMEKDISLLLVDADVAKPHISRIFGIESEPGLLDVLRDERLDVESVILKTDVPGLSILSAGRHSETATELLASARMENVLRQIGERDPNRIVVVDSPPLLLTSESRVLASIVGQVVLVVRAGITPQRAVFDAIDLLGERKPVNLVLNQSEENTHAGYYQQYYGDRSSEASGSS